MQKRDVCPALRGQSPSKSPQPLPKSRQVNEKLLRPVWGRAYKWLMHYKVKKNTFLHKYLYTQLFEAIVRSTYRFQTTKTMFKSWDLHAAWTWFLLENPQDGTYIVYDSARLPRNKHFVLIFVDVNIITFHAKWRQREQNGTNWCTKCTQSDYRRLSLSQSPGDQTKYFEISVVWDSQPVTSFTFFMYVELCISQLCKNIPERNQYLEIICVKKRPWSMPVLRAVSSSLFVKHTYQLNTVSPTRRSHLIIVYIKEPR